MSRWATNQVYRNVIRLWLVLSVASVVMSVVAWRQLHDAISVSHEAVAIKESTELILKSLLDAETAQRGFALTGDEAFLSPFKASDAALTPQFEKLGTLAVTDTNLMNQVLELRAQSEVAMDYHKRVIDERRRKGINAAAELVKQGQGKKIMDDIRRRVDAVTAARSDQTSAEARISRSELLRANLTSVITAIIGLGAGFFAFYLAQVSSRHVERENELLNARILAERESREKSTFLANMSHEIRTPMNAILGFSELLYGEVREPKQRGYIQSIRASATSLLQVINDLLDMSKVEAGMVKLRPEPTDPREICDFIKVVFAGAATRRGIRLDCHVSDDLPRALLLDRGRLRQILVNLVSNAVKFTDKGTIDVTVTWEKQPDNTGSRITLIIEVQDTGVGIPKDRIEAIFKPFVQAGTHQDKERGGTGLGLSIVRQLVQLMGGTVTVASVVGQGSVFHLRFPNVPVSVRLPAAEQSEPGTAPNFNELRASRILVVDDNETNRRLLAGMFAGSHHQVDFGRDGREAVQKCGTFHPAIVLLDIRMPEMNGYEAVGEIRKVPGMELIPVIAVTASSLADENDALEEQFNAHLRKPFSRRQLFNELAHFLPRADKGGGPSPPETTPADPPAWHRVAKELRVLEKTEWPGVRDSLAINETRVFGKKLEILARDNQCPPLLTFAEALDHYAETYSVDDLERHLRSFPALIERIEHPQT
jgi:signal transduction histidine kinase/CheY-like chemotaxis protein